MTEIFTARSVDEAKELAAKKFGKNISEIKFEIVDEGKKGLFGLGAKEAKVKATIPDGSTQTAAPKAVQEAPKTTAPASDVKTEPVTKTVADPTKTYAQQYGSGLYIFKRNVTDGVKYSGYYYDATNDKFYELEQETGTVYIANLAADAIAEDANGVVTLTSGALNNVKLAATKKITIANNSATPAFNITWMKDNTTEAAADKSDATIIRLTYVGDDDTTANKALDDVVIDINLASGWNTNWTYKAATSTKIDGTNDVGYFFYKKLLAPGATSEKLVDSVTLNKDVTQDAYKELVYDLTVVLDSIQVSPDEAKSNGSMVTAVNGASWGAQAAYDGTTVSWT